MKSFIEKFEYALKKNKTLLCIGLDTDYAKIPFKSKNIYESILNFNKNIIEQTKDLVCCYKINSAFYESYGTDGIKALKDTVDYIKTLPVILDAKRADIGNTAKLYAKFGFEFIKADGMTVMPYMGIDTIDIFREYRDKFIFVVAFSSNPGAKDFQEFPKEKNPLYLHIMKKCQETDKYKNTGYVVGATYPEKIKILRQKGFYEIFLIPGIGVQQGDVEKSIRYALSGNSKSIFNVSRAILYHQTKRNYFKQVKEVAVTYSSLFAIKQRG